MNHLLALLLSCLPKQSHQSQRQLKVKHRAETREPVNERPAWMTESKPESRTEVREERKLTNRIEHKPSPTKENQALPQKRHQSLSPSQCLNQNPNLWSSRLLNQLPRSRPKLRQGRGLLWKPLAKRGQEPLVLDEVRITNQTFVIWFKGIYPWVF